MAQYNGYIDIPHQTYDAWRNATLGNGYNADYAYGNQCWDYCAELWHQYNLTLYTKSGGGGAADCWLVSRAKNAKPPFVSLEGKENIKRGDVIVWNRSSSSSTGHIAIADEDYSGSNRIWVLNQNPSLHTQNGVVSRDNLSLNNFLGIFRNQQWQTTPPSPHSVKRKDGFPFVIAKHYWWNKS